MWFNQRNTLKTVEKVKPDTQYCLVIRNTGRDEVRCGLGLLVADERE